MLINSSILDIEGTLDSGNEAIKKSIKNWIKDNSRVNDLKISDNPNNDGKYEVSVEYVSITKNITSLTNGLFVWKEVKENFNCSYCNNLISLEGAPEKVSGNFNCSECKSLKSLEGAPKEIGGYFNCLNCPSLTSLKGAPKSINGDFDCSNCSSLKTLEGAPEKVKEHFYCYNCTSLKSLKGAPKEVGESFYCFGCNSLKTVDLPTTTKINGSIYK